MYKVVLIDDEKRIQSLLKNIIEEFADDVIVSGIAYNVQSGIELIRNTQPDIVFLDIEMPDGTGFDLLQELSNINFSLIFCTGHDGFAIKAFKYNAIDYVLKPFDIEEVITALEKAKENLNLKQKDITIKQLLNYKKTEGNNNKKIILKTANDIFIVKINDIYNCEAEKGYTTFKFKDDKMITVSKNLKEYEKILKIHNFIKTHQSHLVNINYIERFHKTEGAYLVLKNGRQIPISVRKKESILKAIEEMHS